MTIQQTRELLTSLPDAVWAQAKAQRPSDPPYTPNSQAHADAEVIGQQGVGAVLFYCHAGILSAKAHMEALDRVLEPEKVHLAPWSVTRTILEAEARAAWVLEPGASATERVSRAVMLGLRDTEWQLRAVRGGRVQEENNLRGRLKERTRKERANLRRTAKVAGVAMAFSDTGLVRRVGGTKRIESPDDFVEEVLEDITYYDLLSQIIHSNSQAMWLTFEEVLPRMMMDSIYWFSRISWWEREYQGLDCSALIPIFSEAWEQADFPPHTQFWV